MERFPGASMSAQDDLLALQRETQRAQWEAAHTAAVRKFEEQNRLALHLRLQELHGEKPRHLKSVPRPQELHTDLLTVPEAAQRLNMSKRKVDDLMARGHLRSVKIGRSRRVPVEALSTFISRQMDYEQTREQRGKHPKTR
jgi:excisionase family DNA binding protein